MSSQKGKFQIFNSTQSKILEFQGSYYIQDYETVASFPTFLINHRLIIVNINATAKIRNVKKFVQLFEMKSTCEIA